MRKRRYKKRKKSLNKAIKFILVFLVTFIAIDIMNNYINEARLVKHNNVSVVENKTNESKIKKSSNKENIKTTTNMQNILLVNKNYSIGSDYEPSDLIIPELYYDNPNLKMTQPLRKNVALAFENMFDAAKKDGITLIGVSGYRSYDYQVGVFNNSIQENGETHAHKYVAEPGHSEHQTGLAIDVLSTEYDNLDDGFENTKTFKWLKENMSDYGFILRYPKDKEEITGYNYEPWHLRYVGTEAAREILNKNLTLEEYLNK